MMLKFKIHIDNHFLSVLLIIALASLVFNGCAASKKTFAPEIRGPQLIVTPEVARMGVAKLKDTSIIFRGKGFHPNDSVFISIIGVEKGSQVINIPVAESEVNKDGEFTAEVEMLVKVTELLRADIGMNDDMETIILVSGPPIKEGSYTVRAESMEYDNKAECRFEIKNPSLMDRFKDWIGVRLGKIKKVSPQ